MRILFVSDWSEAATEATELADIRRLGQALIAAGDQVSVLQQRAEAAGPRVALGRDGALAIYRSDAPRRDVAVLAATLQPEIVIVAGHHPERLARAVLDAGFPAGAWLSQADIRDVGEDGLDRRLGIFAMDDDSRATLAALLNAAVTTMPPPAATARPVPPAPCALVPALTIAAGVEIALWLARLRPAVSFRFAGCHPPSEVLARLRDRAPANVEIAGVADWATEPPARLLIVPRDIEPISPSLLATMMAAGSPILHGAGGRLSALVGPAGRAVPVVAPPDDWAMAFDALWQDGAPRTAAIAAAKAAGRRLRPLAAEAAGLCQHLLHGHLMTTARLTAGRI